MGRAKELIYTDVMSADPYNVPVKLGELIYDILEAKYDEEWFTIKAKERKFTSVTGEIIPPGEVITLEFEHSKVNPEVKAILPGMVEHPEAYNIVMELWRKALKGEYMQVMYIVKDGKRNFVARTPFYPFKSFVEEVKKREKL
jgi:hypothetical protein